MKSIVIEMPENINCLLITYMQSISLGNINVGQKIAASKDIADGAKVVIDTSRTDVYVKGGESDD